MELIDTHCHMADARLGGDLGQVIARSQAAGVSQWVSPCAHRSEWDRLAMIQHHYPGMHTAYGIHPWYCAQHTQQDMEHLQVYLQQAVAIGECGLDFMAGRPDRDLQMHFFLAQLDLAQMLNKPVILHAVKSLDAIIQILKCRSGLRGVVHGFSGSHQQAERLIDMGFYLGVGTRITWPNAHRLRDVVTQVSAEDLLLETDAPDQPIYQTSEGVAKQSMQSDLNEPSVLPVVLEVAAKCRNMPPQELANQCNANAKVLFQL